jgi:hypothetical protein
MRRVNRRIVSLNVAEAREQLQQIEREITGGAPVPEWRLKIWLSWGGPHSSTVFGLG